MPKLERLVKLARLSRDKGRLSVDEMSRACNVSVRTIYRYLNTLSELELPDEFRGKPVDLPAGLVAAGLDHDDLRLLCHVLSHNPLVKYPYFARRFKKIRRLFRGDSLKEQRLAEGEFIDVRISKPGSGNPAANRALEIFTRARVGAKVVRLKIRGRGRQGLVLEPKKITIRGGDIQLSFSDPERNQTVAFELDKITSMEVCRVQP